MIADKFSKLIESAHLTARDRALFESHTATVKRAVQNRLDVSAIKTIGSFARDTAIHGTSDVDLLAVLRRDATTWGGSLKSSYTVLDDVRHALEDRLPSTSVGRDRQAVVVRFNDGQHPVDVVPARYEENAGRYNYPVYLIPDGDGDWMAASPESHNRYLGDCDASAGRKLRHAAQLGKLWRMTRRSPVPVSGFYTELVLAEKHLCEGARSYAEIMRDLLVMLANRELRPIRDPLEISDEIPAASTSSKVDQALATVRAAADHADTALDAEQRGAFSEAVQQWGMVFKGLF